MTVLSDVEIRTRLASGDVVIRPLDEASLGGASYDVRLGEYYYEVGPVDGFDGPRLYNIYDYSDVWKVWGDHKRAMSAADLKRGSRSYFGSDLNWINIADADRVIMLGPRANLLCHTQEFIGARRGATTMMKARSSIRRSLVNVCQCAGMGDPGYVNRWTMEVHNRGDYYIPLVVGRRIAQIVFMETGPTERQYGARDKYQGSEDLDEIIGSWTPEMMLPRLDRDREVLR